MIPARKNYLDNLFWEEMSGYFILGQDDLDIHFWKVNHSQEWLSTGYSFPGNNGPLDISSHGHLFLLQVYFWDRAIHMLGI